MGEGMQTGSDYTNRLLQEVRDALAHRAATFQQDLRHLASSFEEGLQQLEPKLATLRDFEIPAAEALFSEAIGHTRTRSAEDLDRLGRFSREIRLCETQEEILTALLD